MIENYHSMLRSDITCNGTFIYTKRHPVARLFGLRHFISVEFISAMTDLKLRYSLSLVTCVQKIICIMHVVLYIHRKMGFVLEKKRYRQ